VVVWNPLLQADSEGPSLISDKAFTAHDLPAFQASGAQDSIAKLPELRKEVAHHGLVAAESLFEQPSRPALLWLRHVTASLLAYCPTRIMHEYGAKVI
jgi:hypothetical protein